MIIIIVSHYYYFPRSYLGILLFVFLCVLFVVLCYLCFSFLLFLLLAFKSAYKYYYNIIIN